MGAFGCAFDLRWTWVFTCSWGFSYSVYLRYPFSPSLSVFWAFLISYKKLRLCLYNFFFLYKYTRSKIEFANAFCLKDLHKKNLKILSLQFLTVILISRSKMVMVGDLKGLIKKILPTFALVLCFVLLRSVFESFTSFSWQL